MLKRKTPSKSDSGAKSSEETEIITLLKVLLTQPNKKAANCQLTSKPKEQASTKLYSGSPINLQATGPNYPLSLPNKSKLPEESSTFLLVTSIATFSPILISSEKNLIWYKFILLQLKCQLIRIHTTCTVVPKGMYVNNAEDPK